MKNNKSIGKFGKYFDTKARKCSTGRMGFKTKVQIDAKKEKNRKEARSKIEPE